MLAYRHDGEKGKKMYVDKNRKGLIRGCVELRQDHGDFEPIIAYTFWYRHDEPDLENVLQKAIDGLMHYYMKDHYHCGSLMMWTEWRDYRK